MSKKEFTFGSSSPYDPLPVWQNLSESRDNFLKIEILERQTVIFRYLVSKLLYTEEYFSDEEVIILWEVFERIVLKINVDNNMRRKYGNVVFLLRSLFQSLNYLITSKDKARKIFQEHFLPYQRNLSHLFSKNYYYSVKGQLVRQFKISLHRRFPLKHKDRAYIGIGYRDKGTAKETYDDGTPSWQEVAVCDIPGTKERDQVPNRPNQVDIFKSLRVHPLQLPIQDRDIFRPHSKGKKRIT